MNRSDLTLCLMVTGVTLQAIGIWQNARRGKGRHRK
jgi:hypothetical protein